MQAAVLHEFGPTLSVEEVPRPVPGPDDVLIEVEVCGVCHSDLHVAEGDQPALKGATKGNLIPGHEVVGRVVERGANVTHLAVGDRVGVAWNYSTCGTCEACREGMENLCRKAVITGVMVDGGYADFMVARASHALPIPENLSSEEAAPLFCAGLTVYRALKRAGVSAGQKVAIFGVGGLGHLAVQSHALAIRRYLERRHSWLLQEARPPLVTNSLQLVKSLVKSGSHVALTSELDAGPEILDGSIRFIPLSDKNAHPQTIGVAISAARSIPRIGRIVADLLAGHVEAYLVSVRQAGR